MLLFVIWPDGLGGRGLEEEYCPWIGAIVVGGGIVGGGVAAVEALFFAEPLPVFSVEEEGTAGAHQLGDDAPDEERGDDVWLHLQAHEQGSKETVLHHFGGRKVVLGV